MLANKLLSCVGGEEQVFSDDVFTSYTRTGTGSDTVVTTGIDMTKGYMLWSKGRSAATDHAIYDSARGVTLDLVSNSTAAQTTQSTGLKTISSTGHTVGSLAKMNTSSATYVDWVFRKATKFFDVVTYTGDGVSIGRTLTHTLAVTPGMVLVKATSATSDWYTWHRVTASGNYLKMNTTAAQSSTLASTYFGNGTATVDPTASNLIVGLGLNTTGVTYVAYLFAHDPSADGIVQCGSFTTDGSGNATVNLGWEAQYVMVKGSDVASGWSIHDVSRGTSNTSRNQLRAEVSDAEDAVSTSTALIPKATGFTTGSAILSPSKTYIYIAIRRPNKPPTTGTQVYNAIARTGTGAAATVTGVGFAPDLMISKQRGADAPSGAFVDRLRGRAASLISENTNAELTSGSNFDVLSFEMNGVNLGVNQLTKVNSFGLLSINHFFKRAPGVFDVVCYTGNSTANRQVSHSLGVAPELIIVKNRSRAGDKWGVYHKDISTNLNLYLNIDAGIDETNNNFSATASSSVFTVDSFGGLNIVNGAYNYVAYLFASCLGISKVGSYTGNGTSQTIDCGFTTGSRYVCIKAISTTGNWLVADSVRGIVSGSDPYLALNSTAAEVTTEDWLDPSASGFLVNQVAASNANVTGVTYIYWSIA